MIYAVSLGFPVKKAYGGKAMQSSLPRIQALINQDPGITLMDAVILGPKDVVGPRVKALQKALDTKHEDVCVIYIYSKDSEENNIDVANKYRCKKVTADSIKEAVDGFLEEHIIKTGGAVISSKDFQSPTGDMIDGFFGEDEEEVPEYTPMKKAVAPFDNPNEDTVTKEVEYVPEDIHVDIDINSDARTLEEKPLTVNVDVVPTFNIPEASMSLESSLMNVQSVDDWDQYTVALQRDAVIKRLISENTAFSGLVNMIDTLEYEIESIWLDPALSADMKFDKIKEIGLKRSAFIASSNDITTSKIVDVITKITLSAKRTVELEVSKYTAAIGTIVANKKEMMDTSHISAIMEERAATQYKLMSMARKILDLYKKMDNLVTEEIENLDAKLPSSNEFINNMVKPIGTKIFTPTNSAALVNKLMQALQANRVTASALESQVRAVIELMFELFEKDKAVIDYQERMISMLKANNVEDIVIADTVLKRCMRIYTGADDTGRSATAITWAGILSRRQNSLLVDLTGKAKFKDYGIKPMLLEDFMSSRVEKRFLCVEATEIPTPEYLQDIVAELKTRLNYYPYINVIVDPEDTNGINQLSVDALTMHYICNCTIKSVQCLKAVISKHTYRNIARRLIMIAPPISPLSIIDSLNADPSLFATTTLPNIPDISACALRHDRPYEMESIVRIFEEAFR